MYALIFYTGSGSDFVNAGAVIEANKANWDMELKKFKIQNY